MRHRASISDDNSTPSPGPAGTDAAGPGSSDAAPTDAVRADAEPALSELIDRVCGVLADTYLLEGLSDEGVRARVGLLGRLEGQVTVALAAATRTLTTRGAVKTDGAPSATAWLRANTGRSVREASRMARFASSFEDLPATAEALAAGRISAASADAIVHAARDTRLGPPSEVEARLLPIAQADGPEAVRAATRTATQQADGDSMLADETRQHALRRLSPTPRDDGMWEMHGQLPAEIGNATRTLLDIFDTPDPKDTPHDHRRRPDQRLADAWTTAVDVALGCAQLPTTGGITRPHICVTVDLDTLQADLTDPDQPDHGPVAPDHPVWADLAGGQTAWAGTLSPQAARRICCDAGISRIVTAGTSQILDVGRETRIWSVPQRRAINTRDRACRGPGCDRPIGWTQIHHLHWWRNLGHTNIDNGLALRHHCHRLIHDHGWHAQLDLTTAAVTWTSPGRRRTVITHPRQPG